MQQDGRGSSKGFSGFKNLKGLEKLRQLGATKLGMDPVYREYEDTIRRLLKGDFADLNRAQKEARVEQIISVSSMAAMATASAPLPFLEMPVQMAMVKAIAKVHGNRSPGKKALLQLAATAGAGLVLRQLLRLLPIAGNVSLLSRLYAATWALGRAANLYFSATNPSPEAVRQVFEETLNQKEAESTERMEKNHMEARFAELSALRDKGVISEEEYRRKRADLLSEL